jgi:hypothetical protein
MAEREALTAEAVRQLLDYDPATGLFRWKARTPEMFAGRKYSKDRECSRWNARYAGYIAGSVENDGYLAIKIDGKKHKAHRLAWLFMTGAWPIDEIDHIDRIRTNNAFGNLRESTRNGNAWNKGRQINNTSGFKGVSYYKRYNKYMASIRVNRKQINLGYFTTPEAAHAAYCRAAREHHGEFARFN